MSWKLLDDAVASAICPMFQALVPATSAIAVVAPIFGPKGLAVSMVSAQVASLSMLGASATCPPNDIGPDPGPNPDDPRDGCVEYAQGTGDVYSIDEDGNYTLHIQDIVGYKVVNAGPSPGQEHLTAYRPFVKFFPDGEYAEQDTYWNIAEGSYFSLVGGSDAVCLEYADDVPKNPDIPDHIYTDPETNCNYTVKFEGFIREYESGPILPVFQVSGGQESRNDYGRMGGCNLSPTIHVSPPNGPGGPGGPRIPPLPWPPGGGGPPVGGVPWWAAPILAGSTSAALNLIGQGLQRMFAPSLPAGSFTLTAPCDKDEKGNALQQRWTYPPQSWAERSMAHEITMLEALQTHLNWKTPICREKPELEGTWISTRWESDSNSPASNRPLRKLFRYRSKSTRDDEQLREYWSAFQWEAGPVCVRHQGAWWGNPQVWAATPEEGQRVIRFAGVEAGLDPDQTGEWAVSSSNSPRYGMSGTMRLEIARGMYWVTRREGPSGVPG